MDSKATTGSNETQDFEKVQTVDSNELRAQSSKDNDTSSINTDTSSVVEKSYGIRKSELIMAQLTNWWYKDSSFSLSLSACTS